MKPCDDERAGCLEKVEKLGEKTGTNIETRLFPTQSLKVKLSRMSFRRDITERLLTKLFSLGPLMSNLIY